MSENKPDRKRGGPDALVEFIFEAGMLKRVPRSGWSVLGINNPESVADHSFRCAVIGYLIARMENVSVSRVLLMTLFNDIHEARITDLHKMAQKYIDAPAAENRSFADQVEPLPADIRDELSDVRSEYAAQETAESIVARDSDILECLVQAREYHEQGHNNASLFMKNAPIHLRTASAKQLWKLAQNMDVNSWWSRFDTFER